MSHADRIAEEIDLPKGPGNYMQQCIGRMEVQPGMSYLQWFHATELAARILPNEGNPLPEHNALAWELSEPAGVRIQRTRPVRKHDYSSIGSSRIDGQIMPPLDPIMHYMNCLLNLVPKGTSFELARENAERVLVLDFAGRNAALAYAVNQGAREYEPYGAVDPYAMAARVLDEAKNAVERYKEAQAQSPRYR